MAEVQLLGLDVSTAQIPRFLHQSVAKEVFMPTSAVPGPSSCGARRLFLWLCPASLRALRHLLRRGCYSGCMPWQSRLSDMITSSSCIVALWDAAAGVSACG